MNAKYLLSPPPLRTCQNLLDKARKACWYRCRRFKMAKRGAQSDLNRDNWDEDEGGEEVKLYSPRLNKP